MSKMAGWITVMAAIAVLGGCESGSETGGSETGGSGASNDYVFKKSFGAAIHLSDIVVDTTGDIYAAGVEYDANRDRKGVVIKLDKDGNSDSAFGNGGIARNAKSGAVNAIALLHENGETKSVIGGDLFVEKNDYDRDYLMTLWKFDAHGALDSPFPAVARGYRRPKGGFGTTGVLTDPFEKKRAAAVQLGIDDAGRIVVAGDNYSLLNQTSYLWRFKADGFADTAFNGVGFLETNAVTYLQNGRFIVQPQGALLFIGSHVGDNGSGSQQYLQRYLASGELDAGFGSGGVVIDTRSILECAQQSRLVSSAVQAANGRIFTAGSSCENGNADVVVLGYESDGSVCGTFGDNGKLVIDEGGAEEGVALALDNSGNLVVAGNYEKGHEADGMLWKIDQNGHILDRKKVSGSFSAMKTAPDGDIVVGGREDSSGATIWKFHW